MKQSFSLLELIFVILIIAIVSSQSIMKNNLSKIKLAKSQIILHLKYVRYIAMLDNKYDYEDSEWYKKRWSLRFENCDSIVGGIFYTIYSDENKAGGVNKTEVLRDPLTNNYIFATSCKKDKLYDKSKFVLLTQEYEVQNVVISCNETSTLGQISFGHDGKVYAKSGEYEEKYEIKEPCRIKLYDNHNQSEEIIIYPNTGYIEG